MAVHIDGFVAATAHTVVVTDKRVSGKMANVMFAADTARTELVQRAKPGINVRHCDHFLVQFFLYNFFFLLIVDIDLFLFRKLGLYRLILPLLLNRAVFEVFFIICRDLYVLLFSCIDTNCVSYLFY